MAHWPNLTLACSVLCGALTVDGCSIAQEREVERATLSVTSKSPCAALKLVSKKLPQSDRLNEAAVRQIADAAGALLAIVDTTALDEPPEGVWIIAEQAVNDAAAARAAYHADADEAKAAAANALDAIRGVVGILEAWHAC